MAKAVSIYREGRRHDPKTWEGGCEETRDWLSRMGIYCLSGNHNSILLWSHYAHTHRSYCLQFEATDHTPMFCEALSVQYVSDFPVVDVFNTPDDEPAKRVFCTKYLGWSYEENWRSIDHQRPGLRTYPAERLKGVIFGLRMPACQKEKIKAWVRKPTAGVLTAYFRTDLPDTQVLVSTQSSSFLDNFDPEDVIVVSREGKESQFTRPDAEKLEAWLDEYSLGEVWEKNVIGGGPH